MSDNEVRVQLSGRTEAERTCMSLRSVTRDGQPLWQLCCPICGEWGDLDDDQLHGRVSVDHTGMGPTNHCTFHETHDFHSYVTPQPKSDERNG